MNLASRIAAGLLVAAMLIPASAEAKRRFGSSGGGIHTVPSTTKTSRGMVVVPVVGASRANASESDKPGRVPFPPATAQQQAPDPTLLKLTANDDKNVWCRSDVVVGGFCILN